MDSEHPEAANDVESGVEEIPLSHDHTECAEWAHQALLSMARSDKGWTGGSMVVATAELAVQLAITLRGRGVEPRDTMELLQDLMKEILDDRLQDLGASS